MNVTPKYLFIGPSGHGKSTSANKISGTNVFTSGSRIGRITTEIDITNQENITLIDCPGFGDLIDERVFLDEIWLKKNLLLDQTQIHAIILVIKFNGNISSAFKNAAVQFCQIFSREAINSLCILCIQGDQSITHSTKEFKKIVTNSEGYLYLKKQNSDKDVAFILWDNLIPRIDDHVGQSDMLERITRKLVPFDRIKMQRAIDIVELKLAYLKSLKYESQTYSQSLTFSIFVFIFAMGYWSSFILSGLITKSKVSSVGYIEDSIYLFVLGFSCLWFHLFKMRISEEKQNLI